MQKYKLKISIYLILIVSSSVGVEVDKANLDIVVKEMAGKSVEELIAAGSTKLASMPSGTYFCTSRLSLELGLGCKKYPLQLECGVAEIRTLTHNQGCHIGHF